MSIFVDLIHEKATVPKRSTDMSVGFDFLALESFVVQSGTRMLVPSGVRIQFPPQLWMQLYTRSSLALRGLHVRAGTIDPDFRGEIKFLFENVSPEPIIILAGEKMGQGVFHHAIYPLLRQGGFSYETGRGVSGFGSTDRVEVRSL